MTHSAAISMIIAVSVITHLSPLASDQFKSLDGLLRFLIAIPKPLGMVTRPTSNQPFLLTATAQWADFAFPYVWIVHYFNSHGLRFTGHCAGTVHLTIAPHRHQYRNCDTDPQHYHLPSFLRSSIAATIPRNPLQIVADAFSCWLRYYPTSSICAHQRRFVGIWNFHLLFPNTRKPGATRSRPFHWNQNRLPPSRCLCCHSASFSASTFR